jgi:probable HAF family extracellular repeat protein
MHIPARFAIPFFAALMASTPPATADPLYTMTFLPDWLNADAINNAGQMTGVMRVPGGSHAFLLTDGDVRDLGTLGGTRSGGAGLSDNGMVTGYATLASDQTNRAFIYANGTMRDLGTLPGGTTSGTSAINDFGQASGAADNSQGEIHAVLADSRGMRDLGTLGGNYSYAAGINQAGHVVGASTIGSDDTQLHAFFYRDGVMTDLGDFGGIRSYAHGINDRDQIIGAFVDAAELAHSFLYTDGELTMLGGLGGQRTDARDINNLGQVVGESTLAGDIDARRGFLYTEGKIHNLNALVDSALGWTISTAMGINDSQQILAYACHTNDLCRTVRLDPITPPPVPEPGRVAMLLAGLAAGGFWRGLRQGRRAHRHHR